MSTVYTLNGKVLKNAANDKWLAKKEAPAGFVMNASNVTITVDSSGQVAYLAWQGPAYPNGYNGEGKQFIVVNNNTNEFVYADSAFMYTTDPSSGGPDAIAKANISTNSTGTLIANQIPLTYGYGAYLAVALKPVIYPITEEQAQEYAANLTITILDP
jgi:hypothetical protein